MRNLTGSQLELLLRLAANAARRAHADRKQTHPLDAPLAEVLAEVAAERARQDEKWGQQDWPSVTKRFQGSHPHLVALHYGIPSADTARRICDEAHAAGRGTFAHILIEEVAEAIGCLDDEESMREELVQVAAVAVAWVQAIDRRRGAGSA